MSKKIVLLEIDEKYIEEREPWQFYLNIKDLDEDLKVRELPVSRYYWGETNADHQYVLGWNDCVKEIKGE